MMVIIVRSDRPRPESPDKMNDQQRIELFRSMSAYGGTYTFHGDRVEHHIDISSNEVWTGTTVIRDIKKEEDRLVFPTKPAPFSFGRKNKESTPVWEKGKKLRATSAFFMSLPKLPHVNNMRSHDGGTAGHSAARIASRPSVSAAGPGCRISGDLISTIRSL